VTITGTSGSLHSKTSLFLAVSSPFVLPPPVGGFGSVNIDATSNSTTETLTFTTGGTLGSISVLTQGIANLDFANSGGGTCASGTTYAANATCTVNVRFTPKYAGTRYGAVVLADAGGNLLGKLYLKGNGVGPQATFIPGTQTMVGSSFLDPHATAILGDGSVYVTDYGSGSNGALYFEKFANGTYTQSNTNCTLKTPVGIAVDGSGTIYVTDPGAPSAYKVTITNGNCVETAIGSGFGTPFGIAVDGNGDVYITDLGTSSLAAAVYKETLQANGTYIQSAVGSGWTTPAAVAVDGNGNVDVADYSIPGVFMETPSSGSYTQTAIGRGWTAPSGIAVDASGNIYVSDAGNSIVYGGSVPAGVYKEVASGGTYIQTAIGSGWVVPFGIAVDASGNLYVADQTRGVFKDDLADPPALTFANAVGGTSSSDSPKTVTVSNLGTAALQFSSVAYPSDFPEIAGVPSDCASSTSLGPGGSCTLSIKFLPTTALGANTSLALNESVGITTNTLGIAGTQQGVLVSGTEVLATGSIALSVSSDPAAAGTPITFTGTVTGSTGGPTPTGTVSFYNGATLLSGPLTLSNGVATYSTSSLPVGTYAIFASYSGDATYLISNSNTISESIVAAAGTSSFGNTNIGTQNIGSTSSVIPLTITFSAAEMLSSISVLTEGAPNLDFVNAGGGTCSIGTAYPANASCTVNVTFAPKYSGTRYGAVVLADNNGSVIGTGYLEATGVGPQTVFLPGTLTSLAAGFGYPQGVAIDGTANLYVADASNATVYKETLANGTYSQSTLGSGFSQPSGVAVDGAGNLYVTDIGNHAVYKEIPTNGGYVQTVIGYGFIWPSGVAVDALGNVYVADFGNGVTPGSVYLETLSNGSYTQSTIGSGFVSPQSVAIDGSGNIYVADSANGDGTAAVFKLTPSNSTYNQTTIGTGWVTPTGVAADGNGNIYVTDDAYDLGYGLVVKETLQSDGSYVQSTVLGNTSTPFPSGVAVDGRGNIYVTDNLDGILYRDNLADPPALNFATTIFGSTSSDSPKTITVQNAGNATLTFSTSSYPVDFPEVPGIPSDCTSSTWLAAEAACTLSIDFRPASLASTNQPALLSENVSVVTNSLNAGATAQAIAVSGTEAPPVAIVTLTVPANVSTVGAPVTLTAMVTGQNGFTAPTGSVTFNANSSVLGTVSLNNGTAAYTANSLALGTYTITGTYSGDQTYSSANSNPIQEQIIPTSTFGTQNIGSLSSRFITITFSSKVTLGSISVVTQGTPNLDFTNAGGGTCTVGKAYSSGATCTINIAFNPRFSGTRYGAIVLGDNKGHLIQTIYLQGTGIGSQANFLPGTQTVAGNEFPYPCDYVVDRNGNFYISQTTATTINCTITKWTLNNGSYSQSTVPSSTLSASVCLAVDAAGNVYIADTINNRVLKETLLAGTYSESTIGTGVHHPTAIAVDGAGNVYILDEPSTGFRVLKETLSSGSYIQTIIPTSQLGGSSNSLEVDGAGNVYLADLAFYISNGIHELNRLFKETSNGGTYVESTIGSNTDGNSFVGFVLDGNGNIYISPVRGGLQKETPTGGGYSLSSIDVATTLWGSGSLLAVSGSGDLYVGDCCDPAKSSYSRILKVSLAAPPTLSFAATNVGSTSSDSPQSVTVENVGNATLTFPIPGTGTNPSISSSFTMNSLTTCPQISASGSAASLNVGSSCIYGINFAPIASGTISGSLILTDNALNAVGGTQTIPLSGTGTGGGNGGNVVMAMLTLGKNGTLEGAIQAKGAVQPRDSSNYYKLWADAIHQTLVQGFVFLQTDAQGNLTCNLYSTANVKAQPAPLYGALFTSTVNYALAGNVCPGKTFPFTVVNYTWNADAAVQQDTFILQARDQFGVYLNEYGFAEQRSRISATPLSPTSCTGQTQPSATLTLVNPPNNATGYTWQISGGNNQVHFLNGQQTIKSTNNSVPINMPQSGIPSFNLTVLTTINYNLAVVSTQNSAVLEYGPSPYKPDPSPILSITKLQYTNSQDVWLDSPSNSTPIAMSKTVWETAGGTPSVVESYPSVFVSGDSIKGAATFNVSQPPASALPGTKIYGILPNNLGSLMACVDIPAGATSLPAQVATGGTTPPPITLIGANPFPASTTQHFNPLAVTWKFSPTGQDCTSGSVQCSSAGNTSSEVFVTLAQPSGLSEPVMPMTAVKLAIGSGGATTQTAAFNNTWAQFAGPANVTTWDNHRKLYYYQQGVGFYPACAATSVDLLTQPNGSGECGAWRQLLLDALAVNGIQGLKTSITAADGTAFLVKDWTYGTGSSPNTPPYYWRETFATTSAGGCCEMVPLSLVSGDLTSLSTLNGQNSAPPSEKLFGSHYIVKAPAGLNVGGPYFDPSYGVTYQNNCDFETKAVAFYGVLAAQPTPPTVIMAVRLPNGSCNINFSN
jgi:DNA-binding beta-propeller fold protein YncE